MSFRISPATLSDHKAAERTLRAETPKTETKTFFVLNIPVPSAKNGLELPSPYFLPTFETREDAQAFRREGKLEGYSITELVLEKRRG